MKNYIFNNYDNIQSKSLKIINLSIKAQEGECVLLDLLCVHAEIEERLIELRFKDVSCFRGSMLGLPETIEPGLMRVRYVGKVDVACIQRESLLKGVNLTKWELPYVDPVTHQVEFRSLDYQEQVLKELTVLNMLFKKIRRQIKSLKVVVRAKWVHKAEGMLDLVPYIKKAFPGGRIQTFTGVHFDALKGLSKIKTKTLGVRFYLMFVFLCMR